MRAQRAGPVQVAAINRIGRSITCMVTCSPLKDKGDGNGDGAVLPMEETYRAGTRRDRELLTGARSAVPSVSKIS